MRKILLLPAVAFMMASCGGVDTCTCEQMVKDYAKMIAEAGEKAGSGPGVEEALEEIEEAIKADPKFDDWEACDKLREENEKYYEEAKECK